MNTFTSSKKAILAVASLMALTAPLFPSVAHAIPTGLHYMVSPVSCVPDSPTDAGKLTLINGAWTFKDDQIGFATLNCPINFSGNTNTIETVILSFRDDWMPAAGAYIPNVDGYVRAAIMYRNRSSAGANFVLPSYMLSSNAESGTNYSYYALDHNQQTGLALNQHPALGNIYYLKVDMLRLVSPGNQKNVGFTGFEIRF